MTVTCFLYNLGLTSELKHSRHFKPTSRIELKFGAISHIRFIKAWEGLCSGQTIKYEGTIFQHDFIFACWRCLRSRLGPGGKYILQNNEILNCLREMFLLEIFSQKKNFRQKTFFGKVLENNSKTSRKKFGGKQNFDEFRSRVEFFFNLVEKIKKLTPQKEFLLSASHSPMPMPLNKFFFTDFFLPQVSQSVI